jgi:hypothetical protein
MGVELRSVRGRDHFTNQERDSGYSEIVCDGISIGVSLDGSGMIKWQPYQKKDIAKSVQSEAVRLCQARNEALKNG